MDEDDHYKEVYAYFGLAIFRAQLLEHAIVNALVICDLIPNKRHQIKSREDWSAQVDQYMDGQFENTAGRLIKELRKYMVFSDELEEGLAAALKTRNFLVHHFFRERVTSWYTSQGRDSMIAELGAAGDQFGKADELVEATVRPLKDRYGLTENMEKQLLADMKAVTVGRKQMK